MQYGNFNDKTIKSAEGLKKVEEEQLRLFSVKLPFSEHLSKWEDNEIPDKYDHNFFEYNGQPSFEEFEQAVAYQKKREDSFIKLSGDIPLKDSFGLVPNEILTMVLEEDFRKWKKNEQLEFHLPSILELEELEVSHFGPIYGEGFARRNIRRLYQELQYYGAYLNGELVGSCYTLSSGDYVCLDGLLVDMDHRHQHIGSSLIAHVAEKEAGKTLFLHAAEDDEPKEMYYKLGFCEKHRMYEYLCTDLMLMKIKEPDEEE